MATDTIPASPTITVTIEGSQDNLVKVQGTLKEVNLAEQTCRVYTAAAEYVTCHFDDALQPDVINALGADVEVAGRVMDVRSNGNGFKVGELRLQSIAKQYDLEFSDNEQSYGTVKDLLESDIVGMWADREDLRTTRDVINYTRRLRGKLPLPEGADVPFDNENVDSLAIESDGTVISP